jgi:cytochrome c biogenesis protein CcdA
VAAAAGGLFLLVRPSATCRNLVRTPRGGPAAFVVGVALGVVNCPACAGIITGVAVSAAALGSTTYSVLVMVALGIGHTLTLLLVSHLSLNVVREAARSVTAIQRTGGVLLLLSAAFFAFQVQAGGASVSPTLP